MHNLARARAHLLRSLYEVLECGKVLELGLPGVCAIVRLYKKELKNKKNDCALAQY